MTPRHEFEKHAVDLEQMSDTLGAAAKRPDRIPVGFMAYVLDYVKTHLRLPIAQVEGGYGVVQDEGTPLTMRKKINVVGSGATATDDATNNVTLITIPGGGAPSGAAGGDLSGTYPNPSVASLAITDAKVATANKDGLAATASMRTLGTGAAQAAAGNDSRLSNSRAPSGSAGGDLTGTYPNPTVAALAITDAKVAAANKDGVAATASLRTLGTGAQQAAAGNDSRLSDSRAPSGTAGGDLTGTYPNPTLGTAGPGATGPIGDSTHTPAVTIDAKGRVTALTSVAIAGGGGALTQIADATLAVASASLDFTSIPATFNHLLVILYCRSAGTASVEAYLALRFNNDTAGNYYAQETFGRATAFATAETLAAGNGKCGFCPTNAIGDLANRFGVAHVWIPNYTDSSNHKTWVADSFEGYKNTTGGLVRFMVGGTWNSGAVINRITIMTGTSDNLAIGSRATVYGMT